MREKILEILSNNDALTVNEIEEKMGFNSVEQLKELLKENFKDKNVYAVGSIASKFRFMVQQEHDYEELFQQVLVFS